MDQRRTWKDALVQKKGARGVDRGAHAHLAPFPTRALAPALRRRSSASSKCLPTDDSCRQFSLSEVSVIESLDPLSPDADGSMFCIKVVQAPLSVVLRCRDENERKRWLSALQVRSARWVDTRGAELAENKLTAAAVIKGGASAPSPAYAPYAPKAALPDYLTSTSTQSLKSAPSTLANSDDSDDDSSHTDADTRFFNSFQVDADEARRGVEADEMTEVVSLS